MSVISYINLNNIIISPIYMCSVFIKFICCNQKIKDEDVVSQPDSIKIPFEEIQKVGEAIETVIDDAIFPESKTVVKKMVSFWDDDKKKD